ncbi:MAG: hypothetical protein JNN11_02490 [Candidatus Doudnabacteria bacterium]|nr:hypothetical protein [Candidatus Doudnabacteria bacterium]
MLETKEQKSNLVIVVVLIISLIGVSLWRRSSFRFSETRKYVSYNEDVENSRKYLAYLNSLSIDQKASKELFETIITKDEIRSEVERLLDVKQVVVEPELTEQIKVSSKSDRQELENYLSQTVSRSIEFNNQTAEMQKALFSQDYLALEKAKAALVDFKKTLLDVVVPKEAEGIHKSLLVALAGYDQLLVTAQKYDPVNFERNDRVWPDLYKSYSVINTAAQNYSQELIKITGKYDITSLSVSTNFAEAKNITGPYFVKTAHAFLGMNFTITVGDIPRIIMDAVKEGLRSAFVQFLGTMLNKLVQKIESNYMIANFLYYSDALVASQYTDDYLQKYVGQQIDRQIIKRFIPQFSCGANTLDLKPVFEAKAKDYLGFSPQNVDTSDPDYYLKMSKVGEFLASPSGWKVYFEDLARVAESEAEKAASKELSSPGLKTARDIAKNGVSKSLNSIVSAQGAALTAILQLGAQNAEGIISGFVSQLTETLINNFVFKGVTGGPASGIGVLKEQTTCLAVAQIQPILALDPTIYQQPASTPNRDELIDQYCEEYPESCQPAVNAR